MLRWLVPVLAVLVVLGGGWTFSLLTASAQEGLKPRTARQLLVDVHSARVDGLSGTVVEKAALGLPALPGGSGSSDLSSLVAGNHTLKVWLSAPDKARVALLGTLGESDVIANGSNLWTWSSHTKTATHSTVKPPGGGQAGALPQASGVPATPEQAAQQVLKAIEPSTKVTTSGTASVAGRPAYELVLSPRDSGSLVGQVRLAIDGATHIPLQVQVFARGASTPAFQVGYTQFDPTRPDPARFDFTPPPGAKVQQQGRIAPRSQDQGSPTPQGRDHTAKVVGHGWTSVVVSQASGAPSTGGQMPRQLTQVLASLPRVSGAWGSGHLLRGTLFSAVLTDDGRVAVGAVAPERLYSALAAR